MWVDDKPVDLIPPDWHFILSQCFLKSEKALSSTRRNTASFIEAGFFDVNYDFVPSFTGWMAHWGISQSLPKHLNVPKAHQWIQKGNAEFGEGSRLKNKAKGSEYFGTCQWWQKMANSCCEKPKKNKQKRKNILGILRGSSCCVAFYRWPAVLTLETEVFRLICKEIAGYVFFFLW